MKNRNILLLVLGLAMIQDQTSAASKHYLVQSKGKQYLIETEGKTEKGKGAEKVSSSYILRFRWYILHIQNESKSINDYDDDDEQPADKVNVEVESDPLVRSFPMALRSRTMKATPIS